MAALEIPQGNEIIVNADTGQFTAEIFIGPGKDGTISITGTFVADLRLRYRKSGETTWNTQDTASVAGRFFFPGGGDYWRMECPVGDFTSGVATIRIQGES